MKIRIRKLGRRLLSLFVSAGIVMTGIGFNVKPVKAGLALDIISGALNPIVFHTAEPGVVYGIGEAASVTENDDMGLALTFANRVVWGKESGMSKETLNAVKHISSELDALYGYTVKSSDVMNSKLDDLIKSQKKHEFNRIFDDITSFNEDYTDMLTAYRSLFDALEAYGQDSSLTNKEAVAVAYNSIYSDYYKDKSTDSLFRNPLYGSTEGTSHIGFLSSISPYDKNQTIGSTEDITDPANWTRISQPGGSQTYLEAYYDYLITVTNFENNVYDGMTAAASIAVNGAYRYLQAYRCYAELDSIMISSDASVSEKDKETRINDLWRVFSKDAASLQRGLNQMLYLYEDSVFNYYMRSYDIENTVTIKDFSNNVSVYDVFNAYEAANNYEGVDWDPQRKGLHEKSKMENHVIKNTEKIYQFRLASEPGNTAYAIRQADGSQKLKAQHTYSNPENNSTTILSLDVMNLLKGTTNGYYVPASINELSAISSVHNAAYNQSGNRFDYFRKELGYLFNNPALPAVSFRSFSSDEDDLHKGNFALLRTPLSWDDKVHGMGFFDDLDMHTTWNNISMPASTENNVAIDTEDDIKDHCDGNEDYILKDQDVVVLYKGTPKSSIKLDSQGSGATTAELPDGTRIDGNTKSVPGGSLLIVKVKPDSGNTVDYVRLEDDDGNILDDIISDQVYKDTNGNEVATITSQEMLEKLSTNTGGEYEFKLPVPCQDAVIKVVYKSENKELKHYSVLINDVTGSVDGKPVKYIVGQFGSYDYISEKDFRAGETVTISATGYYDHIASGIEFTDENGNELTDIKDVKDVSEGTLLVCPSERIYEFTMPDHPVNVKFICSETHPVYVSDSEHIRHIFNGLGCLESITPGGKSDYAHSSPVSFVPGQRVSISADMTPGYILDKIDVYDQASRTFIPVDIEGEGVAFDMPDKDVTVELYEKARDSRQHFANLDNSAEGIEMSFIDVNGWPMNVERRQLVPGTRVNVRAETGNGGQGVSRVIIKNIKGRELDFDDLGGTLNRYTNEFGFKMPDQDIYISVETGEKMTDDISNEKNYFISRPEDVIYTGEEQKQEVTLTTSDGAVLKEGKDYDIAYTDAVNIGTVTVTLTGKGDYKGVRTTSYKILPQTAEVSFTENPSKLYDGEPVSDPAVTTNSDGSITYSYYDSKGNPLPQAPAEAGSYKVRVTVGATDVYDTCEAELDFTIVKGRTVVDLAARDVEDTGEELTNSCEIGAVVLGIASEDGSVEFVNDESGRSVTVPVKKKGSYYVAVLDKDNVPAGEYTITANYYSDSGNYMSASATKTFKERKRRSISVNELFERTYGDDGFSLGASTADPTDNDIWSYEVISDSFLAYPAGTSEHSAKPSVTVTEKGGVSVKHAGEAVIKVTLSEDTEDPVYHEAVAYVTVHVNKARLRVTSEALPRMAAEGELNEVSYGLKFDGFVKGDTRNNFTHGFGTLSPVPVMMSAKASDTPYRVGIAKKGVTVNINGTEFQNIFIVRDYAPVYTEGTLTVVSADQLINTIPVKQASFDEALLNLVPGGSYKLKLTVNPSNTTNTIIRYESDNEDVATVTDEGLVYAVAPGETEVRAVVTSRSGKGDIISRSAVCKVSVSNKKTENVVLDVHETTLRVGDTLTLHAAAHPMDAPDAVIAWSSSNESAAKVVGGMITAVAAGEADITATAGDAKAVCHVTVINDIDTADSALSAYKTSDELWIGTIGSFVYTGSKIEPKPNVYYGNRILKEGTDYKLKYKNNINAGEATLKVLPKKQYGSSEKEAAFTILSASMNKAVAQEVYGVTREKGGAYVRQELKPVVWFNGKKLKEGRDYTLAYTAMGDDAYKKAGSYEIKVTGKGNFDSTSSVIVREILYDKGTRTDLSKVKARLKDTEKPVYDPRNPGKAFEPAYELYYTHKENGVKVETVLTEGESGDYTCSYMDNDRPGMAKVIFMATADGGFYGVKTRKFKISTVKTDISKVSGIGIYIKGGSIHPYEKGGVKPEVTVTDGSYTLKEGVDYRLSYSDNKTVEGKKSPKVTVTGKGDYKGKKSVNFSIVQCDLANTCLTISDMKYSDKPGAYKKAKITLTDVNGKKLTSKDYEIEEWEAVSERPPAGSIVTVRLSAKPKDKKGSGCYEGSVTGSFRIVGEGV